MPHIDLRTESLICFTVDVEWAHPEVLNDLLEMFKVAQVHGTFFCTHSGIAVGPQNERALHPNYRRNGDTLRSLRNELNSDSEIYSHVISKTKEFCPEAIGARSHCLFYDSEMLVAYKKHGIKYDSSYYMPLAQYLVPIVKEHDVVEFPIFYMDHLDLVSKMTGFNIADLKLEQPGLKIFDFHPNIVFINAASEADYVNSKSAYHLPEKLIDYRRSGRGARTLLQDLLKYCSAHQTHGKYHLQEVYSLFIAGNIIT